MGAVFGTPLACGHREYPEVSKQNERDWKKTIKELKKAISLRKYSLTELEDRKIEAEKLHENLTIAYDDLISKKGNFDKAVNIMKDQKDLVELIRQLTNWICKKIAHEFHVVPIFFQSTFDVNSRYHSREDSSPGIPIGIYGRPNQM